MLLFLELSSGFVNRCAQFTGPCGTVMPSIAPHKLPIIECGHVVDVRDYECLEILI